MSAGQWLGGLEFVASPALWLANQASGVNQAQSNTVNTISRANPIAGPNGGVDWVKLIVLIFAVIAVIIIVLLIVTKVTKKNPAAIVVSTLRSAYRG